MNEEWYNDQIRSGLDRNWVRYLPVMTLLFVLIFLFNPAAKLRDMAQPNCRILSNRTGWQGQDVRSFPIGPPLSAT